MFEDMEEELEWFDEPPSFNDLCIRLNAKFGGHFTLKGRFDTGKTRAPYCSGTSDQGRGRASGHSVP